MELNRFDDLFGTPRIGFNDRARVHRLQVIDCRIDRVGFRLRIAGCLFSGSNLSTACIHLRRFRICLPKHSQFVLCGYGQCLLLFNIKIRRHILPAGECPNLSVRKSLICCSPKNEAEIPFDKLIAAMF